MLETLRIKNFAIIDATEISFKTGLNILSGETGAGKSIVIEAISLLLGGRAAAEMIRAGSDEAVIEGLFDLRGLLWMRERIDRLGFRAEHSELLIKRVVHRAGRHRIYINGELATLSILQEVCEDLIDLCGQHEHQSLLKPGVQLDLLDRYGGLDGAVSEARAAFGHLRSLTRERDLLTEAESDRAKRADFLRFQLEELREAALQPGEDEALTREKQLLQSAEGRLQGAEAVRALLDSAGDSRDGDTGAISVLQAALAKARALAALDDRVVPIRESMERALAEVEDASLGVNRYLGSVDLDPERLTQVQERLSLLADLRKKYGATVLDMLATLAKLEEEYRSLETVGERLAEVASQVATAEKDLRKQGETLSKARRKISRVLSDSVTSELKDLKMGDAKFTVELSLREDLSTWTATGGDSIQFIVQTNLGEAAKPVGRIASGGELSRLMLAIRRVIAGKGGIGVYLFDEIDAGIGGQTAFQVGKKLKSVASHSQVICITHLPQVASFADHHLSVRKKTSGNRTATEIVDLGAKERKEELARMLGGPQLTKKSLENAAELLELAR